MKLRRNKKGFTIVELVIVIAVIGVLAAVLIPTFINLTDKANKAADDSLVKNLNTALATQEGVPGDTKNNTLHDAVVELEEYGYKLPNLVTKSGENSLLWNRKTNRFLLAKDIGADKIANEKLGMKNVDYFHIQDNENSIDGYSIYAGNGFNESNAVNVSVGFDVGFKTFSEINYSHTSGEGQEVVIRTNGEDLKIDGEGDIVRHYGKANSLSIIAVANQSYHENGKVSFVEISKGRIVLEQDSKVKHIHVNAIAPVNPEAKATAFEEIIIAKAQQVEMPVLSRDDVEIGAQGTKVVALQEGTAKEANKDYVWLTKQGIYEQIKVSDSATSAGDVWVNTSSKSDETKNAAQQIANNIGETATVGSQEYTVTVNEDREIVLKDDQDQVAYTITADQDGNTVIKDATSTPVAEDIAEQVEKGSVEPVADKEDVETGATLFAGGTGTQKDPFLITDYETFQNVSELYNEGYYYYKVKEGVTEINCANWSPVNLNGSFDGNGVKLSNIDQRLFFNIGAMGINGQTESWSTKEVKVGNFDAYFKIEGDLDAAGGMAKQIIGNNTTILEKINIYGQIVSGSNSGALFSYTTGNPYESNQNVNQTIYINDCAIYANLISTSGSVAIVTGYPNYCNPTLHLVINNPDDIWNGSAYNPNGSIKLVTMSAWEMPEGNTPNRTILCNTLSEAALSKLENGSFAVSKTGNASRAAVYISGQLTETDAQGQKTAVAGITMSVQKMGDYEFEGSTLNVLDAFNSFDFKNKQSETGATLSNGKLTVKIGGNTNYTFGTIKLVVVEYDSNGNVVSYATRLIVESTISSGWTIK